MKRFIVFALFLLVLSACGSSSTTTTDTTEPGDGPTTTDAPTTDVPTTDPSTTVPQTVDPLDEADAAYAAARALWESATLVDYDYSFSRGCFCPQEYVGPHEVSVRDGIVTAATYDGIDLKKLPILTLTSYDEIIQTVDGVFDEIDSAIDEADRFTAEYHPELGYPTDVFIDWEDMMADEEVNYTIIDLRPVGPADECSTSSVRTTLEPQDGLSESVAAKRQQIFDAAISCDIDALAALTDPDGFNASFGGGDAATLWADAEARGDGVLLDLVHHLNLSHTKLFTDGAIEQYTWPSAFIELESADGTGLPAEDFAELLTLYSQDEVDGMFDLFGGYVGYRMSIEANGDWTSFVAGD